MRSVLAKALSLQDRDGYTPLHLAAFYGQYQLVIQYLNHSCKTKIRDLVHNKEPIEYSKNRCIMKAIRDINGSIVDNDRDKFEFLLNSGFSIEEAKSIHLDRPIQSSLRVKKKRRSRAGEGNEPFLSIVLECGADIDSTDSDGWTALHHSCKSGNMEHFGILIKKEANINIFSNHGYYPIHVAALYNNFEMVELLFKDGADLNVRKNDFF